MIAMDLTWNAVIREDLFGCRRYKNSAKPTQRQVWTTNLNHTQKWIIQLNVSEMMNFPHFKEIPQTIS